MNKQTEQPLRTKPENFFRKLLSGIIRYRFALSCAAVVILGAIVLGVVLGGRSRAADGKPETDSVVISAVTPGQNDYPIRTPDPNAVNETIDPLSPHMTIAPDYPDETFPPIETQAPIPDDIATAVPVITPAPLANDHITLVQYREHSDLIPGVQERLMILWYMDPDEPTDYLGSATRAAIMCFQRRNGLAVTGELNGKTYEAIFSLGARVYMCSNGDTGSDVQYLEERLYELGYLDDPDDVFDDVTEAAVKDFQQANSLTADGMVGKNTKEALYNPDCVAKAYGFGDSGEKVLTYQQRLQELGYLTTEPDGVYGNDTKMAVRRFQMQNELIEDGYLGPVTREKLMSDDAVGNALSITMSGSDVLNVQVRLSELNYLRPSDVNSYFTSVTEEAVRLFQRNNNLLEDGKVGRNTMSVLFSENAVRAVHPVNTPTAVPTNAPRPTATPRPTNPPSGGGGGGNGGGGSVQQRINTMISVARSKLGCRYVRGHKGPNTFDCSGFVWWVLNHSGVSIGYMTTYYWRTCQRFTRIYNINNIKRGDVVLFNGHIAICSNTWTIIDASHSNGKVVERSFNRNWFKTNFVCGFRIFK